MVQIFLALEVGYSNFSNDITDTKFTHYEYENLKLKYEFESESEFESNKNEIEYNYYLYNNIKKRKIIFEEEYEFNKILNFKYTIS